MGDVPRWLRDFGNFNGSAWLALGEIAVVLNEPEKALKCYQNCIRFDQKNDTAICNAADLFRKMNQYDKAMSLYRGALVLNPLNKHAWGSLGVCYMKKDDLEKAFEFYRYAVRLFPKAPQFWLGIGILYQRCQLFTDAAKALSFSLKYGKDTHLAAEATFHLAEVKKERGDYKSALEAFYRLLENPRGKFNQSEVWFQIGHVYELSDRHSEARDMYRESLKLDPKNAAAAKHLAWLHCRGQLRDEKKAIKCLRFALSCDPKDCHCWYFLGRCYMKLLQYSHAYNAYRKAVELDPENYIFWCSIGVLYSSTKQYWDALNAYGRAVGINPTDSYVWSILGTLYESCGQPSDAYESYRMSVQLEPGNVKSRRRANTVYAALRKEGLDPPPLRPLPEKKEKPEEEGKKNEKKEAKEGEEDTAANAGKAPAVPPADTAIPRSTIPRGGGDRLLAKVARRAVKELFRRRSGEPGDSGRGNGRDVSDSRSRRRRDMDDEQSVRRSSRIAAAGKRIKKHWKEYSQMRDGNEAFPLEEFEPTPLSQLSDSGMSDSLSDEERDPELRELQNAAESLCALGEGSPVPSAFNSDESEGEEEKNGEPYRKRRRRFAPEPLSIGSADEGSSKHKRHGLGRGRPAWKPGEKRPPVPVPTEPPPPMDSAGRSMYPVSFPGLVPYGAGINPGEMVPSVELQTQMQQAQAAQAFYNNYRMMLGQFSPQMKNDQMPPNIAQPGMYPGGQASQAPGIAPGGHPSSLLGPRLMPMAAGLGASQPMMNGMQNFGGFNPSVGLMMMPQGSTGVPPQGVSGQTNPVLPFDGQAAPGAKVERAPVAINGGTGTAPANSALPVAGAAPTQRAWTPALPGAPAAAPASSSATETSAVSTATAAAAGAAAPVAAPQFPQVSITEPLPTATSSLVPIAPAPASAPAQAPGQAQAAPTLEEVPLAALHTGARPRVVQTGPVTPPTVKAEVDDKSAPAPEQVKSTTDTSAVPAVSAPEAPVLK